MLLSYRDLNEKAIVYIASNDIVNNSGFIGICILLHQDIKASFVQVKYCVQLSKCNMHDKMHSIERNLPSIVAFKSHDKGGHQQFSNHS